MKAQALVSLQENALEGMFGWIDWRSSIDDVAEIFQMQIGDGAAISLIESEGETPSVSVSGETYPIPLTGTESDHYVLICSLAEVLRDTHEVWAHKASLQDDTHGLLVLTKEQSDELKEHHTAWVEQHLFPLPLGVDQFSGVAIPYYGHEDNAPGFEGERQAIDHARNERNAKIKADTEKYMDRYVAMERAANKKSLIERFGFPAVIGTLALIATLIAVMS